MAVDAKTVLGRLRAAADAEADAMAHLRRLVAEAVPVADDPLSGLTVQAIAKAAGVTRQTVYRWSKGPQDVEQALNAALDVYYAHANDANAPTIASRRAHAEIGVKVAGIRIGQASLRDPMALTTREIEITQNGINVAEAAAAARQWTGKWPTRVTVSLPSAPGGIADL